MKNKTTKIKRYIFTTDEVERLLTKEYILANNQHRNPNYLQNGFIEIIKTIPNHTILPKYSYLEIWPVSEEVRKGETKYYYIIVAETGESRSTRLDGERYFKYTKTEGGILDTEWTPRTMKEFTTVGDTNKHYINEELEDEDSNEDMIEVKDVKTVKISSKNKDVVNNKQSIKTSKNKTLETKKDTSKTTSAKTKSVAKKPVSKTTIKKSAVKPVVKKSATKTVVKKSTAKDIVKKSAVKQVVKKSDTKPVLKKSAVKPVVNKSAAKPVVKKSTAKPVVKKSDTKPVVKKSATKTVVKKTTKSKK